MSIHSNVSISEPNGKWVQAQVDSGEFATRDEVVDDLIRQARERDIIRAHLIAAEQSGFVDQTPEQILADIKEELRRNGEL